MIKNMQTKSGQADSTPVEKCAFSLMNKRGE
jgi:hypothetical protein